LAQTMIRKGSAEPVAAASLPELAAIFVTPPSVPSVPAPPMPPMATTVPLPEEFRAWDFIMKAWQLVQPHWLPLGAMLFVTTAIGAVPYLGGCVMLIIGGAIYVGINRSILAMLGGKTPEIGDMFNGFDRLVPALLANLVIA